MTKLRKGPSAELAPEIAEWLIGCVSAMRTIFPSCLSCRHFNEPYNYCNKYQQYPPAKIIVNSCGGYEDGDDPPFE